MEIVRLDGLERKNAGVSIGEKVSVEEADVREVERVTIAPTKQNIQNTGIIC